MIADTELDADLGYHAAWVVAHHFSGYCPTSSSAPAEVAYHRALGYYIVPALLSGLSETMIAQVIDRG